MILLRRILFAIFILLSFDLYSEEIFFLAYPTGWNDTVDERRMNEIDDYVSSNITIINSKMYISLEESSYSNSLKIGINDFFKFALSKESEYRIFNNQIEFDLDFFTPIFFILPENYSFNNLNIKVKDNQIYFRISQGSSIFAPYDLIANYFVNGNDISERVERPFLYLKIPKYQSSFNDVYLENENKLQYKKGEYIGTMSEVSSLLLDIHSMFNDKKIIPIFIAFPSTLL